MNYVTIHAANKVFLINIYPHVSMRTTTQTTEKCPKNVPKHIRVKPVRRCSKTALDYGDIKRKAVLENTKHYQDNWKKYSKSVF